MEMGNLELKPNYISSVLLHGKYPKLSYLKQQKSCCLAIFLGQKSRHGMTGFSAQGLTGMGHTASAAFPI